MNPIVAIMSPQPSIEALEEHFTRQMPIRLNPVLDPSARTPQFLVSGAAFDTRDALPVFLPEPFDAQEGEPTCHAGMKATEA
jgi:hypothetical protein